VLIIIRNVHQLKLFCNPSDLFQVGPSDYAAWLWEFWIRHTATAVSQDCQKLLYVKVEL
jgi:hypothetical protein